MGKGSVIALFAGYFFISVGIFIIPCILVVSESRSVSFWLRILWTEFLFLLVWGWWTGFWAFMARPKNSNKEFGPVLPSIGIVITIYSIVSFFFMQIYAYVPKSTWADRIHMALQVIFCILLITLCIFLYLVAKMNVFANKTFIDKEDSPVYLSNKIEYIESLIYSQNKNHPEIMHICYLLKQLREKIKFGFQSSGSITHSKKYSVYIEKVRDLLETLSDVDFTIATADVITGVDKRIVSLIQEVKTITADLAK